MSKEVFRELQTSDLCDVAKIHIAAFPKSALGGLGEEAVRRYYQWQLHGPHDAIALGLIYEKRLVGFCFAGVFKGSLSGFLRKNRNFLIWRVLAHPWLVTDPLFLERVNMAWKILMKRHVPKALPVKIQKKSFGILSIAIDPQQQGNGYGRSLMLEVEKIAVERGFVDMYLTVAIENRQAISFYERLRWWKLSAPDGDWHGSMMKHIGDHV